jgi:hypothetical protein
MLQAYFQGPGLRDVDVTLPPGATQSESQAVVNALNAQNARIFKVTLISTVVVGFAALLNSFRVFKQLRREEIREEALMRQLKKRG